MAKPQNTSTAPKPADKGSFDFDALTPTTATLPKVSRETKPNPFEKHLAASYAEWVKDHKAGGYQVVVPNTQSKAVQNMIRRAADKLGIGSRVVITADRPSKGQSTVLYVGRDRKVSKGDKAATT